MCNGMMPQDADMVRRGIKTAAIIRGTHGLYKCGLGSDSATETAKHKNLKGDMIDERQKR